MLTPLRCGGKKRRTEANPPSVENELRNEKLRKAPRLSL
ncbi:hypothetical protein HMPREF7215_0484 [Pyramidobacter piscolens W5455]|uniref:Uncharacterized protein n=1 Tax=Pyramidobacter piscolens W5455 TaxID=352165 RepID=A0ABM9ZYL7_9BACT|nr:hypothetical protein HMPREF7215_0484 [Pyramidobacter piscolens W5455]